MEQRTKDRLKAIRQVILCIGISGVLIWGGLGYAERQDKDHAERASIAMDMAVMNNAEVQLSDAESDIQYVIGCIYNSMYCSLEGDSSSAGMWHDNASGRYIAAMTRFEDVDGAIKSKSMEWIGISYKHATDDNMQRPHLLRRSIISSRPGRGMWVHEFNVGDAQHLRESVEQHRELEPQYQALLAGNVKIVSAVGHLNEYHDLMNTNGAAEYELELARSDIGDAVCIFSEFREGYYSGIWNETRKDVLFAVECDERRSLVYHTIVECERVAMSIQEVIGVNGDLR